MVYFYSTAKSLFDFDPNKIKIWEDSLDKLVEVLNRYRVLCIDCETTGLSPLTDKIVMFQFGTATDQYVIDVRGLNFSKYFKSILENEDKLFIGHNIKFDYNMLKQHDIVLQNVYDTMVSDRVIFNGRYTMDEIKKLKRYSLAGVYKHYFQIELSKTERLEFLNWGSLPFTLQQVEYGAKDVLYPFDIKKIQEHWIEKYKLEKVISLENKAILSLADIEYNGVYVDAEKWLNTYKTYSTKLVQTTKDLDIELIANEPKYKPAAYQQSLFGDIRERFTEVNWNSDQQVYKILTEVFDIWPEDKDGKASSSAKALELLLDKPRIVKLILQHRKESKVISSFGKEFLDKYLHFDSRIRTTFNQIVDTGRVSSRYPLYLGALYCEVHRRIG